MTDIALYHVYHAAQDDLYIPDRVDAAWLDILELINDKHYVCHLSADHIERLHSSWHQLGFDVEHGDAEVSELWGFARALAAAAGFTQEMVISMCDILDWIES